MTHISMILRHPKSGHFGMCVKMRANPKKAAHIRLFFASYTQNRVCLMCVKMGSFYHNMTQIYYFMRHKKSELTDIASHKRTNDAYTVCFASLKFRGGIE